MIKIEKLKVWINNIEILKWIDMDFEIWKNYCLIWKNGSWKSTLSSFLMWYPKYKHLEGKVELIENWEIINLLELTPEQRSKAGLFLSFQNVIEIPWIILSEYLRVIYNIHLKQGNPEIKELSPFVFNRFIKKYLEELNIDESFLFRELNVWFSWWEKRKIEILQVKLIWPKYIILDEIDSGLDLDAFKKVANLLKNISSEKNSLIIITHYFTILDYIDVDKVYLMEDWKIIREGEKELIEEIKEKGFG